MAEKSTPRDYFKSFDVLNVNGKKYGYYRLGALEEQGLTRLSSLPYSIRVLLEATLRSCDDFAVTEQDVKNLASWTPDVASFEIPFKPARVILQDFTGVPAVVDLAAMRSAMKRLGGDPEKINPLIPVDAVVDLCSDGLLWRRRFSRKERSTRIRTQRRTLFSPALGSALPR